MGGSGSYVEAKRGEVKSTGATIFHIKNERKNFGLGNNSAMALVQGQTGVGTKSKPQGKVFVFQRGFFTAIQGQIRVSQKTHMDKKLPRVFYRA